MKTTPTWSCSRKLKDQKISSPIYLIFQPPSLSSPTFIFFFAPNTKSRHNRFQHLIVFFLSSLIFIFPFLSYLSRVFYFPNFIMFLLLSVPLLRCSGESMWRRRRQPWERRTQSSLQFPRAGPLPPNGKIAKDAKETVQECVFEFISFVTSEYTSLFLACAFIFCLLFALIEWINCIVV